MDQNPQEALAICSDAIEPLGFLGLCSLKKTINASFYSGIDNSTINMEHDKIWQCTSIRPDALEKSGIFNEGRGYSQFLDRESPKIVPAKVLVLFGYFVL